MGDLAATEHAPAVRALARLALDAAHRVQLLLACRVHKSITAAGAVQLDVGMRNRRHLAMVAADG
jgi:hypothetical protein